MSLPVAITEVSLDLKSFASSSWNSITDQCSRLGDISEINLENGNQAITDWCFP